MDKKYRILIYCDVKIPDSFCSGAEATVIYDFQDCLDKLSRFSYDIIIMQIHKELSNMCEVTACIRTMTLIPVLFLIRKSEKLKKDLIQVGADAVLDIESSTEEIELEIFALVRRYLYWNSSKLEKDRNVQVGSLLMNRKQYQAYLCEKDLYLTRQEYDFLYLLASSPRRIYTFEQIYQLIWKEYPVGDIKNIIWCLVKRLRKKLNIVEDGAGNCIVSVRDIGYKFELNNENEQQ